MGVANVEDDTIELPLLLLKIYLRDGVVVKGFLVVVVDVLVVVGVVDVEVDNGLLALLEDSSELLSSGDGMIVLPYSSRLR